MAQIPDTTHPEPTLSLPLTDFDRRIIDRQRAVQDLRSQYWSALSDKRYTEALRIQDDLRSAQRALAAAQSFARR